MNRFWLVLFFLFLGIFVGLCIPYTLFSGCQSPILSTCGHVFWDWALRILQVVGTLGAVIVALYKESLQRRLIRPNLCMDLGTMQEQLVKEGDNDIANAYNGKIKISNSGSNCASNIVVSIEKIIYRRFQETQTPQVLLDMSVPIKPVNGKEVATLSTDDDVLFPWFSVLKAQSQEVDGVVQSIPMKFMIGSKEIGGSCFSGLIDVTFKLKCDELKPQYKTLRIEWNGEWKGRQFDMMKVFKYKWQS